MRLRQLAKFTAIVGGLLLALYGVSLVFGLTEITLGKFSAGARDTNTALLVFLIGFALALYGWFDPGSDVKSKSVESPADDA
jgi:hypothetical protein